MDLKIKDVAKLLNISETTVRRWLRKREIPCYKLNKRQYRFDSLEIEKWLMDQKLSLVEEKKPSDSFGEYQIYPQKCESQPHSGSQQYSLYRAINRGGVYSKIEGTTKEEIIKTSMQIIARNLHLDPAVLTDLLLDREKLMSTALNNTVAVPHARECLNHIPFDLVSIVFPKQPIEWGALDKQPAEILFFLFATGDKNHLHLLAKIAHLTSRTEALNFLKSQPEKTELLEYIRELESHLRIGDVE